MPLDPHDWQHHATAVVRRLRGMAIYGADRFQHDRRFKLVCLAVPVLIAVSWLFGGNGSSGSASPTPPPIIVGPGGAGSGSAPAYQFGGVQTAPAPPDPASEQRQRHFMAAAAVAAAEQQPGRRCELMVEAASYLNPEDRSHLLSAATAALADADNCQARIDLGDRRLALLSKAAAAYQATVTPATAGALVRAAQDVDGFNRSRVLTDEARAALAQAQTAANSLTASAARRQALDDAAAAAAAQPGLDGDKRLAAAAEALMDPDQEQLTGVQRDIYRHGLLLADKFQESDRRLVAAVGAANRSGQSPTSDLVTAFGALQPLDLQRATPEQKDVLGHARLVAQQGALASLVARSPISAETPTSGTDADAAGARRVVGTIDAGALAAEQREAIAFGDRAVSRLQASDLRLAAMQSALDAWRKTTSVLSGRQVTTAYQAIIDYDRDRLTPAQETTYAQLGNAFYVVNGKALSLTPATRKKLPILVTVQEFTGSPPAIVLGAVNGALRSAGYRLATDKANAALRLDVTGAIEGRSTIETASSSVQAAITSLQLQADWASDGSQFDHETAKTNAQAGTDDQAVAASIRNAADLLVQRFTHFVETRTTP